MIDVINIDELKQYKTFMSTFVTKMLYNKYISYFLLLLPNKYLYLLKIVKSKYLNIS